MLRASDQAWLNRLSIHPSLDRAGASAGSGILNRPGETAVIRVVYEPHKNEPGAFSKVIQVYSNSVSGRELITVCGNSLDTE